MFRIEGETSDRIGNQIPLNNWVLENSRHIFREVGGGVRKELKTLQKGDFTIMNNIISFSTCSRLVFMKSFLFLYGEEEDVYRTATQITVLCVYWFNNTVYADDCRRL